MQLPLAILTNLIIDTYFNETRCLYIFANSENHFNYLGEMPTVIFDTINEKINPDLVFNHYGCQGFIINSKNPRIIFENIETNLKVSMERFNTRKYLFVPTDDRVEDILDVFESGALEYVADLNVIIRGNSTDENGIFEILTHKYIGTSNYNEIYLLDKWFTSNYSFLFGNNLYPNKLNNQFGRPIKLGTINYVPYSIIGEIKSRHMN